MAAKYPEDDQQSDNYSPRDKECGICLETLRQPKSLPCLHFFCRDCLQDYIHKYSANNGFTCPLCRERTQIPDNMADGFEDNAFIHVPEPQTLAAEKTLCDACEENKVSASCLECKQNYCTSCSNLHVKMQFTKEHHIVTLAADEKVRVTSKEYCAVHPSEELGCFCVECEEVICFKCNMITHKHHHSREIQEVTDNRRQELTTIIQGDIEGRKIKEIQTEMECMKKEKAKLESEFEETCKQITTHSNKIKEKVDLKCKNMVNTLKEKTRHRIEEYERKLNLLQQQMKSTKQVSEAAKNMIKFSGDSEMISKFPTFKAKLDNMSVAATEKSFEEMTSKFDPGAISEKILDTLIGRVNQDMKLKKSATVLHLFRRRPFSRHVEAVCCFEKDFAFIEHENCIKLLQKDGSVKEEIDMGEKVYDITRDQTGQVFVACEKSVKILDVDRKPRTCFSLPYKPSAVTCTQQGDIVVGYQERGEIIQYTIVGKQVKTLNTVRDDGYIVRPYKATFNVNGDLVVSDRSKDDVTVFDVTGKMRTVIQTEGMRHRAVACSEQGHIYVADWDMDRVNMYSIEGHLLQTVIPCEDNGLCGPCGLSLDPAGHLWIGQYGGFVSLYQLSV